MEQNKSKQTLITKRSLTYVFIAYILGGFPWWVWIKPLVNNGVEYLLLFIQIPAFLFVVVSAWRVLGEFHKVAVKAFEDTLKAEKYKENAKKLLEDAEKKNHESNVKLQEAEAVVMKARAKYSNEIKD